MTDCRTLLDQSLNLVSAALGLRAFDSGSFRWVKEKRGNRQLRNQLQGASAPKVIELVEGAWRGWAARLRDYRDLAIHYTPMPIAPLELVRHETEDRFEAIRVHITSDPAKRSSSNRGAFVDGVLVREYPDHAVRYIDDLLGALLLARGRAEGPR